MKFLVFTRAPYENVWVYSGDCFDVSEVDKLCELLKKSAKEGKYFIRIESWPDEEVRDLCKRRRKV